MTLLGLKYLEQTLIKKYNIGQDYDTMDVLEDTRGACTIAVELLNDLLLYEKLDDGMFGLSKHLVTMTELMEEGIRLFKVQVRRDDYGGGGAH